MIKLNYTVEALQQLHTGADENYGTVTMLRREKRKLKHPIEIESQFDSETERRVAIVSILEAVYRSIDQDLKRNNYGFYEAFASKVLTATCVRTKQEFLTELCKSCGIRILPDKHGKELLPLLERFGNDELLQVIRSEHQFLMLMFRAAIQGEVLTFEGGKQETITFKKSFENIPFISGNSIRGIIRRLAMRDYCDRLGINSIDKDMYHQLFTGGNITSSTSYEDIEKREQYIRLCPVIGLLGSAIGNMTIQGKMKVGALRPICTEHGNGEISYWELIGREFGTRHDSSKTETEIEIIGEHGTPDQMKYELEVFNTGTEFDGDFILTSFDPLYVSAFWHIVGLWKDFGYVGGNSARGYGKIGVNIEIPENANQLYLDHLQVVREEAKEFFNVAETV